MPAGFYFADNSISNNCLCFAVQCVIYNDNITEESSWNMEKYTWDN
jgi:hypothetical protein